MDSRREKREKIRDAEGERLNERGEGLRFGRKRTTRDRHEVRFAGLQNRENESRGDRKEEERVSGWFIESLSAWWICARRKT